MSFLESIFDSLDAALSKTVLQEMHEGRITAAVTGRDTVTMAQ